MDSLYTVRTLLMSEYTKPKTVCRRCGSAVAVTAAAAAGSGRHHPCGCPGDRQHCRMAARLCCLPSQVCQLSAFAAYHHRSASCLPLLPTITGLPASQILLPAFECDIAQNT